MEAIKLKTHIGADGALRLQLPHEAYDVDCEVIVLYEPRRKLSQAEWESFIDETYGSLADDPIERGAELPIEIRDEFE